MSRRDRAQMAVSRGNMWQKRKQQRQLLRATIDAKEKQEVVTIDIPGAFLHADNKDYVIMKMNGLLAELMVKTDPKMYRKYVTIKKGRQVLYLRPQKALYGMMKSALLFYKKLIKELKEMLGREVWIRSRCRILNSNIMDIY